MTDDLPLAAEFPPTSQAEWRKLVEAALKGASFDKRLTSQTYDGLRIEPLYPRAAGAKTGRRADAGGGLDIDAAGRPSRSGGRQRAGAARPGERRDRTDAGLRRLAQRQWLWSRCVAGDAGARARRRRARCRHHHRLQSQPADAQRRAAFRRAGESAQARAGHGRHARQHQSDRRLRRLGRQPDGRGASCRKVFAAWCANSPSQGFRGPFAVADGRIIHNAGGSEAQELAFAIASAVDYLRALRGERRCRSMPRAA